MEEAQAQAHMQAQPKGRFGPTTRVMAKRIQEDWNDAIDGRETFLYMFKMP